MVRARKGAARRQSKRRLFKAVKGCRGGRRTLLRTVKSSIIRSRRYATRDRKVRKRELRALWIIRINAACRLRGMRYSTFIHGLEVANVTINRKMLAHLAVVDPATFDRLVTMARDAAKTTVAA